MWSGLRAVIVVSISVARNATDGPWTKSRTAAVWSARRGQDHVVDPNGGEILCGSPIHYTNEQFPRSVEDN